MEGVGGLYMGRGGVHHRMHVIILVAPRSTQKRFHRMRRSALMSSYSILPDSSASLSHTHPLSASNASFLAADPFAASNASSPFLSSSCVCDFAGLIVDNDVKL
jgi:hypothetical protein